MAIKQFNKMYLFKIVVISVFFFLSSHFGIHNNGKPSFAIDFVTFQTERYVRYALVEIVTNFILF